MDDTNPDATDAGATGSDRDDAGDRADVPSVSPADLYDRLRGAEPLTLLDVRDRDEFEEWSIPARRAVQTPHVRFVAADAKGAVADLAADLDLSGPVVVACGEGEASAYVADLLADAGVEAANLAGGMDAWADLLVAHDLPLDRADDAGDLRVRQYDRPASGCLSYLVVAGEAAAVVDPLCAFADRYVADAAEMGAKLHLAVDTHVHADHVSGVRAIADRTDATAVLPAGAADRGLADPDRFRLVEAGEEFPVGESALRAVGLPGHTSEMTGFRVGELLLAGDSVFLDAVARPDLEAGANPDLFAGHLFESLSTLSEWPAETLVCPGHREPRTDPASDGSYTATLGTLRDRLDALALDRERFVASVADDAGPRPANFQRIVAANLGRETLDDETAFELELGPNNCAAGVVAGAD
jgi:glyoxylase-like metal-dependent hydrolase (beta-lactamase superfamily II)/rhodanese-related sulfurtransferase